jgi:hypothetical protein
MSHLNDVNAKITIDYGDHIVEYDIKKVADINLRVWALQDTDMGFRNKKQLGFDIALTGCVGDRNIKTK